MLAWSLLPLEPQDSRTLETLLTEKGQLNARAACVSASYCPTVPRGLHGAQWSLVTRGAIALAGLAMAQ